MHLSSAVLVVVDVQNGFVSPNSQAVVPRIARLVDRWQRAGGATIFTSYYNYSGSQFERLIHWSKLQNAPDTEYAPAIAPYIAHPSAHHVQKVIYSLFNEQGTNLVRNHGWTDLLISGIATESCVLKTAVDAFEVGLTPWVLRDAVASHADDGAHDAGLLVTERFIGRDQVVNTDEVLGLLSPPVPA